MDFICPICKGDLTVLDTGTAVCPSGHSYDRSRAGYYNLLLSNAKGIHGDNIEMVEARRNFLDTGAYLPLAERVSELLITHTYGGRLLDIGCGEGYYTDIIERRFAEVGVKLSVSGFDISKDAVKRAYRRNKNIELAVASAYHMPVSDGHFDIMVNMFSPLATSEILRALRPGGIFLMAIPGENHLFGLKKAVYQTPYKNEVANPEISGFEIVEKEKIAYTLELKSASEVRSLFMMTPYGYRTSREGRERLLSLSSLTTEAEFVIFVYRKQS